MLLFSKNRQQLQEAEEEIRHLRAQVVDNAETIAHLRHLLDLKTQECDELSARVSRMQERSDYADAVEEKIVELEKQADRFIELKKTLERKILRLRDERDEARAMVSARNAVPPSIDMIEELDLSSLQEKAPKKPKRTLPPSPEELSYETGDWYSPLPEL